MNTTIMYLESFEKQEVFISMLYGDDDFKEYLNSRTKKDRDRINDLLNSVNRLLFLQCRKFVEIMTPILVAQKLVSKGGISISSLPLICTSNDE